MMAALFRFEMKKLFSRRLTWVFLGVCLVLLVFSNKSLVEDKLQGRVQGLRNVYTEYEGRVLTDAVAKQARAEFDLLVAAHPDQFQTFDDGEGGRTDYFPMGFSDYFAGAWQGYMDIVQGGTAESQQKAAATLQKYLDDGHYDDGRTLTEADRASTQTEIDYDLRPPVIHYTKGWEVLAQYSQQNGFDVLLLLALALAPLFSGERTAKMEDMVLCSAGRLRAALAKLFSATVTGLAAFLLFYGGQFLLVAATYGLTGAALPSTVLGPWMSAYVTESVGAYYVSVMLVTLASVLAAAASAALASAAFRHPFSSLAGCAGIVAVQYVLYSAVMNHPIWGLTFLDTSAGMLVSKIIDLLPVPALVDGSSLGMILVNPANVWLGLGISLAIVAASAWYSQACYLKRRKA